MFSELIANIPFRTLECPRSELELLHQTCKSPGQVFANLVCSSRKYMTVASSREKVQKCCAVDRIISRSYGNQTKTQPIIQNFSPSLQDELWHFTPIWKYLLWEWTQTFHLGSLFRTYKKRILLANVSSKERSGVNLAEAWKDNVEESVANIQSNKQTVESSLDFSCCSHYFSLCCGKIVYGQHIYSVNVMDIPCYPPRRSPHSYQFRIHYLFPQISKSRNVW